MDEQKTQQDYALMDQDDKRPHEQIQFVVIKLGAEQFGIDIRFIDNIVRMQHITRVPKVPSFLKGVINLRGEVIPVMSLRLRMGLETEEYGRGTRIIILKTETEGNVGFIVDEVREVVTLDTADVEQVTRNSKDDSKNFINGVGKQKNGELISLLDLSTITIEEKE